VRSSKRVILLLRRASQQSNSGCVRDHPGFPVPEARIVPNLPRFRAPRIEAVVEHSTVDKVGRGNLYRSGILFRLFRVQSHVFAKAGKSLKVSEGKLS